MSILMVRVLVFSSHKFIGKTIIDNTGKSSVWKHITVVIV